MKVTVAMDSFKGSLSTLEAGNAVKSGILRAYPDATVTVCPMADGGEGTAEAIVLAGEGEWQKITVKDPLSRPIAARYGYIPREKTAVVEMAAAAGITLIAHNERTPMKTTTYGTGELIRDALEKGCTRFIVGIGGSATNDAGTGMLQALGFQFLDAAGNTLGKGGEILGKVVHICTQKVHPLLKNAHFIVACDVRNPFYGPEGAAHIFARQKGADDTMIATLDEGMRSFAQVIYQETGKDIATLPGSGAAGGMGGGMMAFLNAELKPGADLLLDLCHFDERIADADLIITGEGRIDRQSLMGKVPGKILEKGKELGIPVVALAGCTEDEEWLKKGGFFGIYTITPKDMPIEEAMKKEVAIRNVKETMFLALNVS